MVDIGFSFGECKVGKKIWVMKMWGKFYCFWISLGVGKGVGILGCRELGVCV